MSQNESLVEAIRTAIGAHGVWKLRLKTAIAAGKTDLDPQTLACDDKCDFGKWMYGDTIPDHVRKGPCYEDVRQKHADFHKTLGSILDAALKGKADVSNALLDSAFDQKSKVLTAKMQSWIQELRA